MIDYRFEPRTIIFTNKLVSVRWCLKTLISSTLYIKEIMSEIFYKCGFYFLLFVLSRLVSKIHHL